MDENALVFSERQHEMLHPRRGGHPGLTVEIDADAGETVRRLVEHAQDRIETALTDPRSDPGMVGSARRHLAGEPDPLGAAVVLELTCRGQDDFWVRSESFVESWLAEHGLAFAVCAVTEQSEISTYEGLGLMKDDDLLGPWGSPPEDSSAQRLRTLLAAAGDQEYADVVERLEACVRTPTHRLIAAYFAPTRTDWVNESCAARPESKLAWPLLASLSTSRQLDLLGGVMRRYADDCSEDILVTMVDGLGSAAAAVLAEASDGIPGSLVFNGNGDAIRVLGQVPTDEAFAALVERIEQQHVQITLLEVMERFPVRAVRVLAPATVGTSKAASVAAELLTAHLRKHPELGTADGAPAEARAIAAAVAPVPDAPEAALPRALVEPPWLAPPKKAAARRTAREGEGAKKAAGERGGGGQPVVTGLEAPAGTTLVWAPAKHEGWPAEREKWRDAHATSRRDYDSWSLREWHEAAETFDSGQMGYSPGMQAGFLVEGPDEVVLPLLAAWRPDLGWLAYYEIERLVARHGGHALDVAHRAAKRGPKDKGRVLLPYLHTDVARLMADWLVRLPSAQEPAREWFGRHGVTAVAHLVPDALGKRKAPRGNAWAALRLLADDQGAGAVAGAAREAHGDAAADAVASVLADVAAADGAAAALPAPAAPAPAKRRKKPRALPDWADPAALPQILLEGRDRALPAAATRNLLALLTMSKPGDPHPEIAPVREACDPESLAGFGWVLFRRWQLFDTPAEEGWVLTALGSLGDDGTVRRLTPVIRAWPGESGHAKAVKGLDVLADIGTETALMHLHSLSRRVKFGGLRQTAQEKIGEIAAKLGLTADELADRLVPDFGLDSGGGMVLDYGPRRFTVGFDEALRPHVTDEDGGWLKALPKPGAKDDAESATAAYKRFTALKKDVRTVAADTRVRLESAMATGRRWTPMQFRELFVGHPLVRHIARRLVWLSEDEAGSAVSFRISEDMTLAGVGDDPFDLVESARVGIAHPVHLGDGVAVWSEVFADYEILQPFPQLGRPVHALTEVERATGGLERFEGVKVPTGSVLGLERHGWERQWGRDGDVQDRIDRELPGGLRIVIDLDPGIYPADVGHVPEQVVKHVALEGDHAADGLDAVAVSEMLMQLGDLTSGRVR